MDERDWQSPIRVDGSKAQGRRSSCGGDGDTAPMLNGQTGGQTAWEEETPKLKGRKTGIGNSIITTMSQPGSPKAGDSGRFATTRWSMVVAAGRRDDGCSQEALEPVAQGLQVAGSVPGGPHSPIPHL